MIKKLSLAKQLSGREVSVLVTDNFTIKKINYSYSNKNYSTNVLSFPFMEVKNGKLTNKNSLTNILGEIVVSYEKCVEEAAEQGKLLESHITHLIIHSTLHLLGFDHENKKEAENMEKIEIKILKETFGIKNPYL